MKLKAVHNKPPEQLIRRKHTYADWLEALLKTMEEKEIYCLEYEPEPGENVKSKVSSYQKAVKKANIPLKIEKSKGSIFISRVL